MEITKAEASHLINVITDYMRHGDFLEVTVDVINNTEVTTLGMFEKLLQFVIGQERLELLDKPREPRTAKGSLD